jgi:hypothetical protein
MPAQSRLPWQINALAWRRVKTDTWDDFLPDIIDFKDFSNDLNSKLQDIITTFSKYPPYTTSPLFSINVPETPYLSRPSGTPAIQDRVVYQVAIDSMATRLDKSLENQDVVFGYRVNKNSNDDKLFSNNVRQWLKFRNAVRDAIQRVTTAI